jgi:long-chain acyl-CoA synthetase
VKPWLKHYDSDVRPSLAPYPETTLIDYLDRLASEHPSSAALLFKGATMTYGELNSLSDAFAAALEALGVRKGDRVALVLPNCPQFFIAEFGVWKAGGVVHPLNPTYSERELAMAAEFHRRDNGGRPDGPFTVV